MHSLALSILLRSSSNRRFGIRRSVLARATGGWVNLSSIARPDWRLRPSNDEDFDAHKQNKWRKRDT
jgi:hypothetical protein